MKIGWEKKNGNQSTPHHTTLHTAYVKTTRKENCRFNDYSVCMFLGEEKLRFNQKMGIAGVCVFLYLD